MYANARMSIRLPGEYLDFIKDYARERDTTVSEIVVGYLKRLKDSLAGADDAISPEVRRMIGIVPWTPEEGDETAAYYDYLEQKHS